MLGFGVPKKASAVRLSDCQGGRRVATPAHTEVGCFTHCAIVVSAVRLGETARPKLIIAGNRAIEPPRHRETGSRIAPSACRWPARVPRQRAVVIRPRTLPLASKTMPIDREHAGRPQGGFPYAVVCPSAAFLCQCSGIVGLPNEWPVINFPKGTQLFSTSPGN